MLTSVVSRWAAGAVVVPIVVVVALAALPFRMSLPVPNVGTVPLQCRALARDAFAKRVAAPVGVPISAGDMAHDYPTGCRAPARRRLRRATEVIAAIALIATTLQLVQRRRLDRADAI
jgi:hypothetical protein